MFILTSLDRYNQIKALSAWEEVPERDDISPMLVELGPKHDAAIFRVYEEEDGVEFKFDSLVYEFHFLDDSSEDEFEERARLGIE